MRIYLCVICSLLICSSCFAETIYLKDGHVYDCKIIKETEDKIWIEMKIGSGTVKTTFRKQEIYKIEEASTQTGTVEGSPAPIEIEVKDKSQKPPIKESRKGKLNITVKVSSFLVKEGEEVAVTWVLLRGDEILNEISTKLYWRLFPKEDKMELAEVMDKYKKIYSQDKTNLLTTDKFSFEPSLYNPGEDNPEQIEFTKYKGSMFYKDTIIVPEITPDDPGIIEVVIYAVIEETPYFYPLMFRIVREDS